MYFYRFDFFLSCHSIPAIGRKGAGSAALGPTWWRDVALPLLWHRTGVPVPEAECRHGGAELKT